ncbi:MAG: nucleoside deaminase [Desulfatibacillaceae bacterium]|nr:nucleoside deaminase [Desulfatibacillaceae bacterium]
MPVGAVMVLEGANLVIEARNSVIASSDPTAHAEINAMREAAARTGNYRLVGAVLYSTIEPCLMCMGAAVHARISTVVYGAPDPKWGGAGSLYDFGQDSRLNHCVEVIGGVLEASCRKIMQDFFQPKRKRTGA